MLVSKDMIISEVLSMDQGTTPIFFKNGLHCLGCVMASGETIEEACMVHGINCDSLIAELNQFFQNKDNQEEKA
jgi:hybrid cluster-associated redox disulfide protein